MYRLRQFVKTTLLLSRYYGVLLKLKKRPRNISIFRDVQIYNPQHISIGEDCVIGERTTLCPLHQHNEKMYPSEINIGNRVRIGSYNCIASAYSVTIEDDVLFAAYVHITDHSHGYEDIQFPICKQDIIHKGPVVIGRGSWLAFGCHILSGVTIGEHAVVAANSVVTKDVPAYTIVAGNPAKAIKKYDKESKQWIKV